MFTPDAKWPNFSDGDLEFVVENVAPGARDPEALKKLIREDAEFRAAMIGDENLLERILNDEEIFLHISPALYFEILLRRSCHELETAAYTEERHGRASIPVFDTPDTLKLMKRPGIVEYPGGDDGFVHADSQLRRSGAGTQGSQAAGSVQRHGH